MKPYKGSAGELLEHILRGASIWSTTIIKLGRKEEMKPGIRVSSYGRTGRVIEYHDFVPDIPFQKDGTMSVPPSTLLNRLLKRVKDGGAIFIEKVWVK